MLRFHWKWGENEIKMAADMQETFRSIIEAAGGTVRGSPTAFESQAETCSNNRTRISVGGAIIHELGTVRMGNDPKTSALNGNCQAHEVKNLFVADAAPSCPIRIRIRR